MPPALTGRVSSFVAAVTYDELAARVILAAKNGGRRDVLRAFAPALVALVSGFEVDEVAWVPASTARRRRRGYDQSDVLARGVARRLGVPARRLLRRAGGEAQANRARTERLAGPELVVRRRPSSRVLLVDDVTTTGASLAASATALRAAGAQAIHAAVIAVVDDRRRCAS